MNITQSTDSSDDGSTDILDDSDLMSDLSGEAELQLNITQPPDSSDDSSTDIHADSDLMSYISGEAELPLNITQSTDSSDDSSTDILDDSDLMSYLSGEAELQEKIENSISQLTQDLSDQYSNDEPDIPSSLEPAEKRLKVMADIEALFLKLMRDTVEENPLKLLLRNTRSWQNCVFDTKLRLKSRNDSVVTEVKFSERRSRMKFSLIYFVLAEIYKLLATQETCTKRELYYHHVDRFRSQSVLDGVLNDVSCFLEVPLYELNVFATSKGLVYGPLKLIIGNDEIDCGNAKGVLIPDNVCNTCEVQSDATFILVLEKDAIFEKLLDNGASKILSSCIFMTVS
ncbi:meiotic W68 [Carabus blaptoides fortunei]